MPPIEGWIGGTYQAQSLLLDAQECLNLYPEFDQSSKGRNVGALLGTPGLTNFCSLGGGGGQIRALFAGEQRLFAVSGANFYEIFSDGTANNRGSVANDGLPAVILANGFQVLIVSGGFVYCDNGAGPVQQTFSPGFSGICSTSTTLVTIYSGDQFDPSLVGGTITINSVTYTVATFIDENHIFLTTSAGTQVQVPYTANSPVTATSGTLLDEYFIINQAPNSKLFNLSALPPLGGSHWDASDVASKEGFPDNIIAVFADHQELYLFGDEQSTEVWQDTGNALSPFQRVDGYTMHYGCEAGFSVARLLRGVAWIAIDQLRGGAFAVYAEGFVPQRISTHAVETAWNNYATVADAISFSYIENGHNILVISFPSAGQTWAYDGTTGFWHRRGWWNGTTIVRQRQAFHAYVPLAAHGSVIATLPAQHYVGDWATGEIYLQSVNYTTDAGTQIVRIRASPYIQTADIKRMFFGRFNLDAQVAAGSDPNSLNLYPILDWSDDGGVTWSNQHFPRGTTDMGTFARLVWPRLGASKFKSRVFRITITDKVPIALINASIEGIQGTK